MEKPSAWPSASLPRTLAIPPSGSATSRCPTERLGDVAVAQGQLKEAAQAYQDGLEIAKKLAAGDPSNTQWQRDPLGVL